MCLLDDLQPLPHSSAAWRTDQACQRAPGFLLTAYYLEHKIKSFKHNARGLSTGSGLHSAIFLHCMIMSEDIQRLYKHWQQEVSALHSCLRWDEQSSSPAMGWRALQVWCCHAWRRQPQAQRLRVLQPEICSSGCHRDSCRRTCQSRVGSGKPCQSSRAWWSSVTNLEAGLDLHSASSDLFTCTRLVSRNFPTIRSARAAK